MSCRVIVLNEPNQTTALPVDPRCIIWSSYTRLNNIQVVLLESSFVKLMFPNHICRNPSVFDVQSQVESCESDWIVVGFRHSCSKSARFSLAELPIHNEQ
ncbi:hypothetical protein BDEG_24961 [Batrachochytrium dendrobatidis JEL423]|uniref:Uncharacterized protein n=1 Tax=Batrachochytrium dendrobatidis (strain JEL423) TaxID=403673 RepID=A0A177WPH8_BATDL|nr:hypothetical protein BDEG_24961 [Batrachochytrium dendrobatidis JEL423]